MGRDVGPGSNESAGKKKAHE